MIGDPCRICGEPTETPLAWCDGCYEDAVDFVRGPTA